MSSHSALPKAALPSSPSFENLVRALPMLPGTRFDLNKLDNYRKSHVFDYRNGVPISNDECPGIGGVAQPNATKAQVHTSAEVYSQRVAAEQRDALKQAQPTWVAFDRKVLRFYGFFREELAQPEPTQVEYRIKRVNLYFYLEDDSIQVSQPVADADGGLGHGTLIRRHRIVRGDDGTNGSAAQHFTITDLNVGNKLTLYGRVFTLTGCDKFTREFLNDLGVLVPQNTSFPEDPFAARRQQQHDAAAAANLARPPKDHALRKFLDHDRQVLRFECEWLDDAAGAKADHPETRRMALHYYLADDTIEMREHMQPNAGRDPNAVFLKRARLPKKPRVNQVNGPDPVINPADYYSERDLSIGAVVSLYGRPFKLYDCDAFTRRYYQEHHGLAALDPLGALDRQAAAQEAARASAQAPRAVNPHYAVLKRRADFDGVVLRFGARLLSDRPVDVDRRFVVSYYPATNAFSIFETHQRNTGLAGGRFLEKRRCRKDGTVTELQSEHQGPEADFYSSADLSVGAELLLSKHRFLLDAADAHALAFMAAHPDMFARSA